MDRGFPIDYTGDQTQTEEILKYNSFPGEVKAIESNQSYDSKSSDPVEDRLKIGLSIEKREESVNNNNNMVTSSSFSINMGAASSESFYTSYRAYKVHQIAILVRPRLTIINCFQVGYEHYCN